MGKNIPRFPIEVTQFTVFRLYFGGIQLGVMSEYILPPLLLVDFFKVDMYCLLVHF